MDGNGILHPRGLGLASHLGVLTDIPCIGVAKQLFQVDGLQKGPEFREKASLLHNSKYCISVGEKLGQERRLF